MASKSRRETPAAGSETRDARLSSVIVPVLSSTTVVTRPAISSAWASLIRMPNSAPRPLATRIAVGVASPSAHGHATTSTATVAESPNEPVAGQEPPTKQRDDGDHQHDRHEPATTRSARRWISVFDSCARRTSSTTCASAVLPAVRVTRAVSEPGR